MSISSSDKSSLRQLGRAVNYAWAQSFDERARRTRLINVYKDRTSPLYTALPDVQFKGDHARGAMVNLFQQYVRGVQIALAYQSPKFSVRARRVQGLGADKLMSEFLNHYTGVINFGKMTRQWAVDSCFGDAVAKVIDGPAPAGFVCPVTPRAYRINPSNFIRDRSAETLEDALFVGDVYMVCLSAAKQNKMYNADIRKGLTPFRGNGDNERSNPDWQNTEAYAEDLTRLVDVYIPSTGELMTFPAPNDNFVSFDDNLMAVRKSPVNPYPICRLNIVPDSVEEIARLAALLELHLLANDSWNKAARQTRQSKRNPIDEIGNEVDMHSLLNTPDGEPVFVNERTQSLYTLPAADSQVVAMAQLAQQGFSQLGGNLEVMLGLSGGASTARQTNAILQQMNSATALDRSIFDNFVAEVGRSLLALAFENEMFQYNFSYQVPGTKYAVDLQWGSSANRARISRVSDYDFEVVPLSGAFRTPAEKLEQMTQATTLMTQMMTLQMQGAPLNMQKIMEDIADSFDLIPDLARWWTPQPAPSPTQKAASAYVSTAAPPEGSEVNYNGVGQGGAMGPMYPAGGVSGSVSGGLSLPT